MSISRRALLVLTVAVFAPLPWVIDSMGAISLAPVSGSFEVPRAPVEGAECGSATVQAKPAAAIKGAKQVPGPDEAPFPGGGCSPPPPAAPPPTSPLANKVVAFTSALDLIPGNDGGGEGIRGGIYVVRADGSQPRKIVTYATLRRSAVAHTFQEPDDHPSISPDGRRIAWTSNRADTSQGVLEPDRINWDVWVADINGANPQQLTTGPGVDTEPTWSPDGAQIYWATGTDPFFGRGDLDIWRMNADGTGKTPIVAGGLPEFEPDVSPDGQRLAFTRDTGGVGFRGYEVVTKVLPSGAEDQLTNNNAGDHDAHFSGGGDRLFISSEKGNAKQPYGDIYRLNSTTGEVVQRTTNKLLSRGDPAVSIDNKVIAAMEPLLPVSRGPHVIDILDINGGNLGHVGGPGLVDIHPNIGVQANADGDSVPDYLESGSVGTPHLDLPRRVRAGERFSADFSWTHPEDWHEMEDMELLLTSRRRPIAAFRLLVGERRLSAWDNNLGGHVSARRPGSNGSLRSGAFKLDLKHSRVSEDSTKTLRARLRLSARRILAGHGYGVQVQADDLDGDHQGEKLRGARIRVRR